MKLKGRMKYGWFIDTETPSPGKVAAYSRWSGKPKTYEELLEHEIYMLVLSEGSSPVWFARECMDPKHERWQEAWDLWGEGLEIGWRNAAMAHAGRPLAEEEYLAPYGRWKDRMQLPGRKLYELVAKQRQPGYGRLH
jgi:hypothetical protein